MLFYKRILSAKVMNGSDHRDLTVSVGHIPDGL
jgi:hypothetical protein